jgi:UDPglucose 6-dehydrogenase
MLIGIIGNGFVGSALKEIKCEDIEIKTYDTNPNLCDPIGLKLDDLHVCEIIFISVPTPMNSDGSCYLNIIHSVLRELHNIQYKGHIVLRSTIPVGTCDKLKCNFMPEFLTEKNYKNDFINNKQWFFGLLNDEKNSSFIDSITKLFLLAFKNDKIKYNDVVFLQNKECEMIKLFRNCFLATKVSFCNEIYEFCGLKETNYEIVRKYATTDERIMPNHTHVPGHDGLFGYGGTCFPKDCSSLKYEMDSVGMKSYILESVINRNVLKDRTEKDWCSDKGRAVVD